MIISKLFIYTDLEQRMYRAFDVLLHTPNNTTDQLTAVGSLEIYNFSGPIVASQGVQVIFGQVVTSNQTNITTGRIDSGWVIWK